MSLQISADEAAQIWLWAVDHPGGVADALVEKLEASGVLGWQGEARGGGKGDPVSPLPSTMIERLSDGRWAVSVPPNPTNTWTITGELLEWLVAEHNRQVFEIQWWKGEVPQ